MVYINNFKIIANSLNFIAYIEDIFNKHFSLKNLDKLRHYLNIYITKDKKSYLTYLN